MDRDFDRTILDRIDHRPWAMPDRPWVMTQTWHDLLFAHWPVDPQVLASRLPPAFELDLYNGQAWLGIVPFRMTNVAPRGVPSLPRISEFPELNVRTYVRVGDRAGVYFFSLDAGSALAARTARMLFNLPYHPASMLVTPRGNAVEYLSRRGTERSAEFNATYEPTGPSAVSSPGSLEYFLTERYCLYHADRRGTPYRLDIHHPPWPLQTAEARIHANGMASANGLATPGGPPLLHFARRLDMVAWAPSELGS
jgi:uncharacterized protein YqjF (DUF2071 family)